MIAATYDDCGRRVIYRPRDGGEPEVGILIRLCWPISKDDPPAVFVRYDRNIKKTYCSDLEWEFPSA